MLPFLIPITRARRLPTPESVTGAGMIPSSRSFRICVRVNVEILLRVGDLGRRVVVLPVAGPGRVRDPCPELVRVPCLRPGVDGFPRECLGPLFPVGRCPGRLIRVLVPVLPSRAVVPLVVVLVPEL